MISSSRTRVVSQAHLAAACPALSAPAPCASGELLLPSAQRFLSRLALLVPRRLAQQPPRMRVSYRRQHPWAEGDIPDFLRSEFVSGTWERTGFDIDFPAIAKDPRVAAAIGYTGRNFIGDSVEITRWYNRATNVIAGSVFFSAGCEGPPGSVHGGAVASALDDILGTMVWREAGFSRWGIPTMQLTVRYRGATPMDRRLRFDTRVVKREGRKVFVEATLRDPAHGNKLLAEGEGLFYMRRPPPPPPPPPQPSTPKLPPSALRHESSAVRTAADKRGRWSQSSTIGSTSVADDPRGEHSRVSRRTLSPSSSSSTTTKSDVDFTSTTTPVTTGAVMREVLSYDEAILEFGRQNPNADVNLVAFYGGNVTAIRPRARL
ncbi:unnamed protein product [Scytosiphon promiscuus]